MGGCVCVGMCLYCAKKTGQTVVMLNLSHESLNCLKDTGNCCNLSGNIMYSVRE